jgi:hypothetical protein
VRNTCREGILVYSVNIRCMLSNLQLLLNQLEQHRPHIVLIQETWLDKSVEKIAVVGYTEVSRRDRKETANRGGIVTLQRSDFNGLVHIKNCDEEERSWHFLKVGIETVLLANWYRPGASDHDGFVRLHAEVAEYFQECSGVLMAGDLNVHHKKWLRHSNDNTAVGTDLKAFCDYHGMSQLVREPTRNEYLLDLVITDICKCSVTVLPRIADHNSLLVKLPIPEVLEKTVKREVWMLKDADWKTLKQELGNYDWRRLHEGTAEVALDYFLEVLWLHLARHIPRREIDMVKSSHPWVTQRSKDAIAEMTNLQNTPQYAAAAEKCEKVLAEERLKHVQKVKTKLASLKKGSKQWWKINNELLHRKGSMTSIPTLREDGNWITDPKVKADAFARTFASKSHLPDEIVDTPFFGNAGIEFDDFIVFRSRATKRFFTKLDERKATGGDMISAAILKRLSDCIGIPFTIVVRRLFHSGCWPSVWKTHLICPIFKRGAAFKPENYRGVHLTTILSKIAEKMVGAHLVPYLQRKAFGDNQWAFTPKLSSRDLVAMLMLSFILAVCTGKKIGCFLSDISGAFDRVCKEILLAKMQGFGVGEIILKFLDSYLAPRIGNVVVQGQHSVDMVLANSVFQGTVLGPPLWNSFFSDVSVPAKSTGGRESMFADDLNVFQEFDRTKNLAEVQDTLQQCREKVHKWGKANRVSFDPSKEHLVVLHPSDYHGPSFKLLGLMVDTDLAMESAIDLLLTKIRPKIKAILRTRGYHSVSDLIMQFKTHIWGLMEAHMGGIFHATSTRLDKIDHEQDRFLRELGISAEDAFEEFNFAPPRLRRNIGILGLLHKRVLGLCHPSFDRLLPWYSSRFEPARGHGHNKTLYGHNCEVSHCPGLFSRSIFAMVDMYNTLPQHAVDCSTVSEFQSYLNHIAHTRCQQGDVKWSSSFCRRTWY